MGRVADSRRTLKAWRAPHVVVRESDVVTAAKVVAGFREHAVASVRSNQAISQPGFAAEKMMAPAPGQNATVEEILASIRQAISEDDAKRTSERTRHEARALPEKKPVATVSSVIPDRKEESEIDEVIGVDAPPAAMSAEALADQQFIEHAIEQALDGVRAELESVRPMPRPTVNMKASTVDVAVGGGGVQRAVPRARITGLRRDVPPPPRRALMSPKAESSVSGSFDDLAKAMMGGNSGKLDEVVEDLLRPMLKQWLEGNLPQMVERLVREEIERVSRGGR